MAARGVDDQIATGAAAESPGGREETLKAAAFGLAIIISVKPGMTVKEGDLVYLL